MLRPLFILGTSEGHDFTGCGERGRFFAIVWLGFTFEISFTKQVKG